MHTGHPWYSNPTLSYYFGQLSIFCSLDSAYTAIITVQVYGSISGVVVGYKPFLLFSRGKKKLWGSRL